MLRNCFCINFVRVIILTFGLINMTRAGTCWVKRMETGKCKQPLSRNISKKDCCSAGPDVGYTEKDMNEFEYFFATAIGDGTSCISCVESCETAKCGANKRCVIRNNQPKCICSPLCKASKESKTGSISFMSNRSSNQNVDQFLSDKSKKLGNENNSKSKNNQRRSNKLRKSFINFVESKNSSILKTSEKLISSTSQNNLNSNLNNKKNKILVNNTKLVISQNFNNNISDHRHRHSKVKTADNRNYSNWKDKIQSSFIGYDIPYPPNTFSKTEQGPYFNPVCGTDGRTYKTECQLKKRACRKEITSLTVAYKGQCQTSCKYVRCSPGMHCLEDQNLMPHCVKCSMKCPPYDETAKSTISNPSKMVCGTDGITYRNLCEIKRTACLTGRSIPVAYRGSCTDTANCNNIKCKDRQICLNDLITHRPRCLSCSFKCPRRRRPQGQRHENTKLCGLNDLTYQSWCQMMKDSCSTGYYIDVQYNGECKTKNHASSNTSSTAPIN